MTHDLITKQPTTERKRPMNKLSRMTRLLVLLLASLITNQANAFEELWTKDITDILTSHSTDDIYTDPGNDGSLVLKLGNMGIDKTDIHYWYDSSGNLIRMIEVETELGEFHSNVECVDSNNLVLKRRKGSIIEMRFLSTSTDTGWFPIQSNPGAHLLDYDKSYIAYVRNNILTVLSLDGSSTTASNSNSSNSGSTTPESTPDASTFSGWAYFSSYPWVYNYDNKAWYYMQSKNDGLFAYNTNVSGNGWLQVGAIN
jgi:hypothetical protein